MRSYRVQSICACLAGVLLTPLAARASVVLTVELPSVQTSQVGGPLTTEDFNGFSTGHYTTMSTAVGTITAPAPGLEIVGADQFGGAGGTGRYMAVGAQSGQSEADLALNGPASYVGLWLSALDANNVIKVYSGATLLATLNHAAISPLESASGYFGNPNSAFLHQDPGEPFAYLNITGTGGTTFDKIVFLNNSQNTGEEIDNISVQAAVQGPAVPAPAAAWAGMGLLGCLAAMGLIRRRGISIA